MEKNKIIQLEETFKHHWIQQPEHFRANKKLKYVVEGIAQTSLKHRVPSTNE